MTEALSPLRVAFQGEHGAFSEEAAIELLGRDIVTVPRRTFESLFSAVAEGAADYLLAPVENTLAGSVHWSYDLLRESPLNIAGEVIIQIRHNLIGCSGATLEKIRTVESHPVALAQCERFFSSHPEMRRIATEDTAGSVAQMLKRGDPTYAAIAGRRAAELYGGEILKERIEDHSENYTRFVLLTPDRDVAVDADKLSLIVKLRHQPGALVHALEPFARRSIDLLKIESRPVKGQPWEYHFYLDLRASIHEEETVHALNELRDRAAEVRVLGCYRSGTSAQASGR